MGRVFTSEGFFSLPSQITYNQLPWSMLSLLLHPLDFNNVVIYPQLYRYILYKQLVIISHRQISYKGDSTYVQEAYRPRNIEKNSYQHRKRRYLNPLSD